MISIDFDINIREFVELLQKRGRPPTNEDARCKLLATELVEGQNFIFWNAQVSVPDRSKLMKMDVSADELGFLQYYYYKRWKGNPPSLESLQSRKLLDEDLSLLPLAFQLYDKHLRSQLKVFISYRRSESSMFALYLHERLSDTGFSSFLDMQSLEYGQNWRLALKDSIQECGYFILLLAPKTLGSKVVVQEITWAFENNMKIIPAWHGGFHYEHDPAHNIPPRFKNLLTDTHTLIIEQENPAQYKQVVEELLRYFDRELDPNN